MCELNVHGLHYSWERKPFSRGQREGVAHSDETQIHHKRVVRRGRLRDDDKWGLQSDVHRQSETLQSEVLHTGGGFLRRLRRGNAYRLLGFLEVIYKCLRNTTDRY